MGCAALLEALPMQFFGTDHDNLGLWDLGREVVESTWSLLDSYDPIRDCKQLTFLGIAHGWAGLLYGTLRWCQASRSAPPGMLLTRLHELAECATQVGGAASWPRRNALAPDGQDAWVGWCNGSAGYIFLWNQAHDVFRDQGFFRFAEKAGQHVWKVAGQGSDLCCGVAGQAYALLNMYKCSGDRAWLDRAKELAQRAFMDAGSPATKRNCLYKGDGGIALLAAELQQPAKSCLPLFEPEGWPAHQ
jgi:serine/threonine-protein kinase